MLGKGRTPLLQVSVARAWARAGIRPLLGVAGAGILLLLGVSAGAVGGLPTVTSVTPSCGPAGAVTHVTIGGTNFLGATGATFGAAPATNFAVTGDTAATADSPAIGVSVVDVHVQSPLGTSGVNSPADTFTFAGPPSVTGLSVTRGSSNGGTSVTITGANFSPGAMASFGGSPATTTTYFGPTQLTAVAPAHSAGTVEVLVTSCGGASPPVAADHFDYIAAPTVTQVAPGGGQAVGGTSVVVTGTGFRQGGATSEVMSVKFGTAFSTNVSVTADNQLAAIAPPYTAGAPTTVDIVVSTNDGGASAPTAGDHFTYTFPIPAVTGVSPQFGPVGGGTSVTISGTGFTGTTGAPGVKFGAVNATAYTVSGDSSISATSPREATASTSTSPRPVAPRRPTTGPARARPVTPSRTWWRRR